MKRIIIGFVLAVWLAVAIQTVVSAAVIKWGGNQTPVQVNLYDATDLTVYSQCNCTWNDVVLQAVAEWNQSSVIHINYQGRRESCSLPAGVKGIVTCTFGPLPEYYPGETNYGLRGHTIIAAVSSFNLALAYPQHNVACHEIGHALGLYPDGSHPPYGSGSCLAGDSSSPTANDFAALEAIYD